MESRSDMTLITNRANRDTLACPDDASFHGSTLLSHGRMAVSAPLPFPDGLVDIVRGKASVSVNYSPFAHLAPDSIRACMV